MNRVSAPIIIDTVRDRLLFLSSYYYIGHFTRYIQPGAQRIGVSSNRDSLEVTAFANPDNTIVVIVLNQSDLDIAYTIHYAGGNAYVEAPEHSITTFILNA